MDAEHQNSNTFVTSSEDATGDHEKVVSEAIIRSEPKSMLEVGIFENSASPRSLLSFHLAIY